MVCGTKRGHATRTFGKGTTRMPKPKANLAHGGGLLSCGFCGTFKGRNKVEIYDSAF